MLAVAAALVAPSASAANALPASGELSCLRAYLDECTYTDPDSGLVLSWPVDWPVRRLRIVTETGPAARARQRDAIRWLSIEYLPDDAVNIATSLFQQVAVLRRSRSAASCNSRRGLESDANPAAAADPCVRAPG